MNSRRMPPPCALLIDDLHEKSALVIRGGSEQARAKHLARGKFLPRERIDALLDPGSAFLELSTLAAYGMYGENRECQTPTACLLQA
jgi:3-methylcrotonyl-CoA carboxylase beta subunit